MLYPHTVVAWCFEWTTFFYLKRINNRGKNNEPPKKKKKKKKKKERKKKRESNSFKEDNIHNPIEDERVSNTLEIKHVNFP